MTQLDPLDSIRTSVLEIRGDGKAGGGLVLAFQSLANLFLRDPKTHVQEWPFFSSARRGANIRSFLRVSKAPILAACEVTRPTMVVLMDEGTGRTMDFALGVPPGGTFILNTRRSPEECARHFHLSGRVLTVAGDDIGTKHLKHAIGNVSVYVAMAHAIGGLKADEIVEAFLMTLKKRRIPESIVERNRHALEASIGAISSGVFEESASGDHAATPFGGYGELPVGAQTALRLSQTNRTADFAPSGFRLRFEDPKIACTGCAHCIANCPEGIILFKPDEERGVLVTGVDVNNFCKLCRECIAICPEDLFRQVPLEDIWEEATVS